MVVKKNLKMRSIFLEAVVNSSADGIWVVDLTGKKILQNQHTLDLWNIPEEVANDTDGRATANYIAKSRLTGMMALYDKLYCIPEWRFN